MLVAGWSGDDTRLAATIAVNPAAYGQSGMEARITGVDAPSATVENL